MKEERWIIWFLLCLSVPFTLSFLAAGLSGLFVAYVFCGFLLWINCGFITLKVILLWLPAIFSEKVRDYLNK